MQSKNLQGFHNDQNSHKEYPNYRYVKSTTCHPLQAPNQDEMTKQMHLATTDWNEILIKQKEKTAYFSQMNLQSLHPNAWYVLHQNTSRGTIHQNLLHEFNYNLPPR